MAPKLLFVLVCSVVSVTRGAPERDATVRVWRGLEQCAHTIVIPKTDPEDLKATVNDLSERMKKARSKLGSLEWMMKDDQLNVFSTLTKVLLQEQENSKQIQLLKDEMESLKQSAVKGNVSGSEQEIHPTMITTQATSEEGKQQEVQPTRQTAKRPEITEVA
ncbi:Hypp4861 [Branchiostoma lanceolatum]|uniref:Hypp4861 protein n=1 Tax=Branchiostoma lanceolatum TaxID=7740 RepID=A0A8K0EZP8_BRALA|nr:Hypp4861 [Branchiostoma lanceolatum]